MATINKSKEEEREAHVQDIGFKWRHIETPDTKWLKDQRNHELIYLTGAHPLNAEPPFSKLMGEGLITPTRWHFIRNHGEVPPLSWETHTLTLEGLVSKPQTLSMPELLSLPADWHLQLLVTITCDGNRRKEVNMIERTRGFNWGPAATSTSNWSGVSLRSLLLSYCGGISCKPGEEEGLYVCFEGADQLSKGNYASCIPLSWALDPQREIMIAYEMNGERLSPDHGFPIRLIMPGCAGGRMIKWLQRIMITDKPSDSHYFLYDNRFLPPNVDFDEGVRAGHFNNPDTALYENNVNSVIYQPSFGEILSLPDPSALSQPYTLTGYAYCGGGRKVVRVELSMDGGKTWKQCNVKYADKGKGKGYWAWCHWSLQIECWRFLHSGEIVVRAVDSSFNTQPEQITWNALGVLNNAWYRVQVKVEQGNKGLPWISFHHPVKQGSLYGGWMMPSPQSIQEYKQLRVMPTTSEIAFTQGEFSKLISEKELKNHIAQDDCWVTIDGAVYDLSGYMKDHPGGCKAIACYGGMDASRAFHDIHDQPAFESKEMFRIGLLHPDIGDVIEPIDHQVIDKKMEKDQRKIEDAKKLKGVLNPRQWVSFTLTKKVTLTRDIRLFTFHQLSPPESKAKLGLPSGQHVLISAKTPHLKTDNIVRPYTPIHPAFPAEDDGVLNFLIKIYPNGKMTQILEDMEIGGEVQVKGPSGPIMYLGGNKFLAHGRIIKATYLSMIAGGTGITPIYQMARAILYGSASSDFQISILTSNHTPADIPLRNELDKMEKEFSDRLKVHHTVGQLRDEDEKAGWKYSVGFVDIRMMKDHLFVPNENRDILALVCGPPAMVAHTCFPSLEELGYTEDNLFEF